MLQRGMPVTTPGVVKVTVSGSFSVAFVDTAVMQVHGKHNESEDSEDTEHNDHFHVPFLSAMSRKNIIMNNMKTIQKMHFWGSDSLVKNSPAKYPANKILEKSPIRLASSSLDFTENHFMNIPYVDVFRFFVERIKLLNKHNVIDYKTSVKAKCLTGHPLCA